MLPHFGIICWFFKYPKVPGKKWYPLIPIQDIYPSALKLAVMDCFPTYYYLTRNFLVSFRIRSLEIDRLNHKSFSSLFLDILSLFGSVWLLYSENKVLPQRVDHKSSFAYGTLTFYWKKNQYDWYVWGYRFVQLNKYETAPYFFLSNMKLFCLDVHIYLAV